MKRSSIPNTWPVPRKGTTYVVNASHSKSKSIPLLFILRDILKIVRTRKEAKYLLLNNDLKINNQIRRKEEFPVQVLDVVSIESLGKHYRLEIVNKKFNLVEIKKENANKKIIKISGKKLLGKNRVQMNLEDSKNYETKEKFSVGDSIVLNFVSGKIDKILPLKEGANVEIISGKHSGQRGKVKAIEKLERSTRYLIKLKEGEVMLPLKTLLVIE